MKKSETGMNVKIRKALVAGTLVGLMLFVLGVSAPVALGMGILIGAGHVYLMGTGHCDCNEE